MVATVEQLAELVRGRLVGDGSVSIRSARPVGEAGRATSRSSRTSGSPSCCAARPRRPRSSARTSVSAAMTADQSLAVIEVDDPMSAFLAVRTHLIGEHEAALDRHSSPGLRRPDGPDRRGRGDLSVRLRGRRRRRSATERRSIPARSSATAASSAATASSIPTRCSIKT